MPAHILFFFFFLFCDSFKFSCVYCVRVYAVYIYYIIYIYNYTKSCGCIFFVRVNNELVVMFNQLETSLLSRV